MTTTVVWDGAEGLPTVVVFDPAPPSGRDEVPPAWRRLTERRQVVWCRFAVNRALAEVDRLLGDADAFGRPIDAVVHGDPSDVLDVLRRHAGPIRAAVVVDAEAGAVHDVPGVRVVTVGRSHTPPRPLAGDAVCADVTAALDALDAEDLGEGRGPERREGPTSDE
ncbi:hypothetical protein [Saccharomonospora glauca]|uniref:Uncharacterized protein n=1 Tax=Saccharomonospora glauca K62 TaxID=928724 RepID=I1D1K5_9PSEU|nr:hypothetical protein [Saccharomonospora glauca]EIE98829.1 hypothetical protein SacglDRAFT_01919 [Saccharomonospora glauca K62]